MRINMIQPKPKIKLAVLFLKRKRAGFMPEWGELIEHKVRYSVGKMDFEFYVPDVKIVDNETLCEAMDACCASKCDVYLALQTTMSDGRMAPVLGARSKNPVVFWATTEKQDTDMISACSLVGAHTFCATLAQLGYPFELVDGMPGEDKVMNELSQAIYRAYAYGAIKNSQTGLVGYHAPGFIDMHVDPFSLRNNLGIELHHIGLHEFIDEVKSVCHKDAVADLDNFLELCIPVSDGLTREDLLMSSKYYLAMKRRMKNMNLASLAVREWPEISSSMGWPYLAMARIASEGLAIACEGDVDGALSCLTANASGCGAAYLSDWLENDKHHITLWHGGAAPLQLCNEKIQLALHFNGKNPLVLESTLKGDMNITMLRLWHMGGKYCFTAIEGKSVIPKRHLKGTNGVGYFPETDVNDFLQKMLRRGFPHHPVIVEGHRKKHLYKLMDNLGINCLD